MNKDLTIKKNCRFPEFIFFGNYFYGLCAAALSVEATLQQRFPLNGFSYFFLIFFCTVLYYTYPYVRKSSFISSNPRTNWYSRNYNFVKASQILLTLILLASFAFFLWNYWRTLLDMLMVQWILIFIFPFVAVLYYGNSFLPGKCNLRRIGWLKPFVIGFIWAGLVTIYPVMFYCIVNKLDYQLNRIAMLLFLKNFMFITVLCIMFDIKDYAADYINRLRTFVVGVGLRKTIFYILLPLSVIGLGSFVCYAVAHQFHTMKILFNTVPFLLLVMVAWFLRRRRPLMYYLIIVDGLMVVKAVCGSIAMIFFR